MTNPRRWWLRALGAVTTVVVFLVAFPGPAAAELSGQYWFDKLSITKAWTLTKGAGVTVAVVDSGVDATLGDLKGQVLPGVNLSGSSAPDGRSDSGSGCDQYGGCFSHGTDMALVIAGTGKGTGFTGVAPAAKILPVKIQTRDEADFNTAVVAQGIRWAVDHGADIINLSLDAAQSCDPGEGAAVRYAYQHDVIVVASTGNVGQAVGSPANCPGALAVGAIDANFQPWDESNFGPQTSFVAAGVDTVQETLNGTKLIHGNGTSDATAIVAGTFALLRSHFPSFTARQIVAHAINNVHNGTGKFGTRISDKLGYGEILPYSAMTFEPSGNPPNPIYDAWAKVLGPATPSSGTSSSTTTPSTAPSTSAPSTASPPASSSTAAPRPSDGGITVPARSSDDSGTSAGLIVGIVVAILVVLGVGGIVFARSRRGGSRA